LPVGASRRNGLCGERRNDRGFALVAAPAEYGESGVKSFIVSQDGVVYQKDLGLATLNEFIEMKRFDPDKSWTPVPEESE
jgi:hypothetical protein